jgi:enoyl-CoA hydratase/carnithine racemase
MMDRGPMGPTRMEFKKPVIAAINGYCVAGGLELALMCDLRVMDESAKLGILNRRFGVPLIDGGSVRLPELIGLSRALDLIITGRLVDAKEAAQIGIVNRLAKVGAAYGTAMHLAREIAAHPQQCLRADRASAYHATFASRSLEESLQFEADNALHVISKESLDGAQKFVKGMGRHGKFNVNPQAEKEPWELEHAAMKEEAAAASKALSETDKEKMG